MNCLPPQSFDYITRSSFENIWNFIENAFNQKEDITVFKSDNFLQIPLSDY